jgi:hypothetical protein
MFAPRAAGSNPEQICSAGEQICSPREPLARISNKFVRPASRWLGFRTNLFAPRAGDSGANKLAPAGDERL